VQERGVVPVGDTKPHSVDVRIISATNRDLEKMVANGTFREDLFHRLNVVTLEAPPLRARRMDILPLAHHFLRIQAAWYEEEPKLLSPEAPTVLERYGWPGNVRELANVMERAHVLASGPVIGLPDLPPRLRSVAAT